MPLALGTRVGPYEVTAPLGSGGMGEVWRARDTRLGRDVALKVLPRDLLADPERLARFEREAQTLAALNHPHIATLYDIVATGDERAMVMELVHGRTLSEVMAAGPVPPRAALGYAIGIADALSAAHAAGIIHRDLKPANVIIADGGTAKVLDFGIAKVAVGSGVGAPDDSTRLALTGERNVVGTIGYMSPEQVQGRPVDARSDIFSLGVLLFEMLAGRRAFESDSAAGTLSAVLRDDPPPLRTLVPGVSRGVERVTARCLQKDPRHRYQTAADLKVALEDARDDLATSMSVAVSPEALSAGNQEREPGLVPAGSRVLPRLAWVAAGTAIGALAVILAGLARPAQVLTPHYRPFVTEATAVAWPTWSPDGKTLAYLAEANGTAQIFLRSMDAAQPLQLTREPWPVEARPAWSPDGTALYFVRHGEVASVGVAGGEARVLVRGLTVSDAPVAVSPDGRTLVFAQADRGAQLLWTADARTGQTRRLERAGLPPRIRRTLDLAFSPDGSTLGAMFGLAAQSGEPGLWLLPWPEGPPRHVLSGAPYYSGGSQSFSWMPDSRRIVFNANPAHESSSRLFMGDVVAGAYHQLTGGVDQEYAASVAPDGTRIAFVSRMGELDLIEFPVDGGPPKSALQSSRFESYPDVSASGVLAYVTDADGRLGLRVRERGAAWSRDVMPAEIEGTALAQPRLSPDGQRVSVDVHAAEHAIWILPIAGGTPARLERESSDQHGGSWSPDGNWMAYRRLSGERWELAKAPVGGGPVVRLADADGGGVASGGATDWSPTGEWIAYRRGDGLHLVSPDGKSTKTLAGSRPASFRFSRDGGRLFAVEQDGGHRWELATWDVASGRRVRVVALPLASSAVVEGLALLPDQSAILVGAGSPTADIWLLENFEPPPSFWSRWLRQ